MVTSGNTPRSALAARRSRSDGKLYARAAPEKVTIEEDYSVTQEISANPSFQSPRPSGCIKIEVPYDGKDYFTRQAADDVKWGTRAAAGPGTAVIGHLLLADHGRTRDLGHEMVMYNNAGVIPIEVPVPPDGATDELTDDRRSCVINYQYEPEPARVYPIQVDVKLYDPDTMLLEAVDILAKWGEIDLGQTIDKLRRDVGFVNSLEMSITVTLVLPVKQIPGTQDYVVPRPTVKLVAVGWPAITSLSATQLSFIDPAGGERHHPVRYNPDSGSVGQDNPASGRLEWEDVPMYGGVTPEGSPDLRIFQSMEMRLRIGHPGELFTTPDHFASQNLILHAEATVPGYLLSGLEAALYDATGNRQARPGSSVRIGRLPGPREPELITRLSIDTNLYIADTFAKRNFKPYHQFVFDDVIPNDMRIQDILNILRNSRFDAASRPDNSNRANPNAPKWLLYARRSQGPDTLVLLIAVEGEKFVLDRKQIMGNNRIEVAGSKESGRIRMSVLGSLPREHAELAREMNLLQKQLRDRFRFQQTFQG